VSYKIRKATEKEKEIILFLNDVKNRGVLMLFGSNKEIMEKFEVNEAEADRIYDLWDDNFNTDALWLKEEVKLEFVSQTVADEDGNYTSVWKTSAGEIVKKKQNLFNV
jgi:hypothetical protein